MAREEEIAYFDKQYKYIDDNINKLIEIYGGKFVVIYNCRIVDSDTNLTEIPRTLEEYLTNLKTRDTR